MLRARLAAADRRLQAGKVCVARGGRALLRKRANLAAAGMTQDQWRAEWEASRLFLTADGEAGKPWGNETIRWNPEQGWLEVKLPAPLEHLANRPHGRYRLSCPLAFTYRGDEVAAQAATGTVRYDITVDSTSGRWYLDASWRTPARPAPSLDELRKAPVVAIDVNTGHLAVAVVTLPATTRDGRLRAAISGLIATARDHKAQAVVIEDLDFTEARSQGRERGSNRPSKGRRGRGFRHAVSGIPTGKFRDQRPESCPPSTRSHAHYQERRTPPGPAAATRVA